MSERPPLCIRIIGSSNAKMLHSAAKQQEVNGMTIRHTFLNELTSKKAQAIAALPEWRKKNIIQRAFPGESVGNLGWDEALRSADVDFDVHDAKLFLTNGTLVRTHKAIARHDTGEPVGVVGKDFGYVQHSIAFEGLRKECELGNATLEALQSIDNGARVTATALLGFSSIAVPGRDDDALAHFLRATNAHDGSSSASFDLFILRLTCLNGQTSRTLLGGERTRHTKNAQQRVIDARGVVSRIIAAAKKESELFQELANQKLSKAAFHQFAQRLLAEDKGQPDTDRKRHKRQQDLIDLKEFFLHGQGNQGENKYDAFNAITEWLTPRRAQYEDSKRFASKFKGNESGTAAKTRARALRLLAA